jgi:hypothetical protein
MNQPVCSFVVGILASVTGVQLLAMQPDDRYLWPEGGMVYTESTITPWKARTLAREHHVLTLLKVSEITVDVAKSLVIPHEDTFLTCPAVEKLDAKAAAALAKRPGYLRLWGLKALTPETAAALVGHKGQTVELTGVREITAAVAAAISGGKRYGIELGLTSISVHVASELAKFQGEIFLPDMESLSIEAAMAFRVHKSHLDLGKAKITADVAEILLLHEGEIGMIGVKRLEPGVGDILARHKAEVYLQLEEIDSVPLARKMFKASNASNSVHDLRTMSPEIAAEYAREDPGYLANLDSLPLDAAKELARGPHELDFPALSRIAPDVASTLTDRKYSVYLTGIKSLEGDEGVRVAEALASTPAPVFLEFLERVSEPALAALRKKPSIKLPPIEKLKVVP